MKHKGWTKKFLSILMAMAIICSLAPAARAASNGSISLEVGESQTLSASFDTRISEGLISYGTLLDVVWSSSSSAASVTTASRYDFLTATVTGNTAGWATITATPYYTYAGYGTTVARDDLAQTWTVYVSGSGTISGNFATMTQSASSIAVGGTSSLSVSAVYYPISSVTWTSSNSAVATVASTDSTGASAVVTGVSVGTAVIYATVNYGYDYYYGHVSSETLTCSVTVGGNGALYLSDDALQLSYNSTGSLTAYSNYGIAVDPSVPVTWTTSNASIVNFGNSLSSTTTYGSSVTLYSGSTSGEATISASATINGQLYTASCAVTVGSAVAAKATVYTNESGFTLGSTNTKTTTSVVDQIANSLYSYSGTSAYRTLSYVVFNNVTTAYGSLNATAGQQYSYSYYGSTYYSALSSITFTPSQTNTGTATFSFTAYDTAGTAYPGTLTIVVEKGSATIDVLYSLTAGQSLSLDADDFAEFWNNAAGSRGTLQYVTFGAASGSVGRLVYTRVGSSQTQIPTGTKFYVSPSANQYGIDSVSFVPNGTSSRYSTGTLVIPFTAYGTSSYYSSSTTSQSGNLYIVVTNGAISSIDYQSTGTNITLDPSDFVSVYKQAVSTTTSNPTVYIQLLDVPTYGSLYYNYGSSLYSVSGTKLNSSNIANLRFTSRTNSTYGIDDLTYIPSSATKAADTVRYAAFSSASGGTLLYVGEINFGATVVSATAVKYYGAPGATINFSSTDFYANSALYTSTYIAFGNPSSGALYKNYSGATGTRVTTSDTFSLSGTTTAQISSVNTVTYVPSAGYTGVVEIPYTASGLVGGHVSGTIKIYLAKTFSDVAATNWAYEYVTQLSAEGVVSGTTPTTFSPNANVKYGEALKMILLAAGYPQQTEGSGSNWASSYLTLAFRYGIVSSTNIDLNAAIDRDTVAAIAAKALKITQAASVNSGIVGPTDSRDGYVLALYNAGILNGTTTNGVNRYNGSSALTRAELAAIVCRVNDYNS